jgi:pSer/pThr/pTyr-binding forkhead associated (FHA) protein
LRSYLLSWLAKKHAGANLERFVQAEPHDWLVWEAGPWRPPSRGRETVQARPGMPGLNSGESLAIALLSRAGDGPVTLGRNAENDLVIDDATLSRAHMRFTRGTDGRWTVRDLGSSNGTTADGADARDQARPLRNGSVIEAGAVRLTFYDAAGFYGRLKQKE